MKARFSVPSDFKLKTLRTLSQLNLKGNIIVEETYGSLNPSPLLSGRSYNVIPKVDMDKLEKYIRLSKEVNIGFNYLINLSCTANLELYRKERKQNEKIILDLFNIGVTRFTIASKKYIKIFESFKGIDLTISTISQLYEPCGIKYIKKFSNVRRICLPEKFNRNLSVLKSTIEHAYPLEVSVIVNNMCLLDCPFRNQHYNYYSHLHPDGPDPNIVACSLARLEDPIQLIKSPWIRPEDLNTYVENGVKIFKIAGRGLRKANFIKMLEAYSERYYTGDLVQLFRAFSPNKYWDIFQISSEAVRNELHRIISKKNGCNELECEKCRICDKIFSVDQIVRDKISSIKFKDSYNEYLHLK